MNAYMHTIDGRPAFMSDGQICFVRDGFRLDEIFVDSLATIRKQQKQSCDFRKNYGWSPVGKLSYIRVQK